MRLAAVNWLEELPRSDKYQQQEIAALAKLLKTDSDAGVRAAAVPTLWRLVYQQGRAHAARVGRCLVYSLPGAAGKAAVETLIAALKSDHDAGVRNAVTSTLPNVAGEAAIAPLAAALQDADLGVLAAAAVGLANLKDPRALKPLLTLAQEHRLDQDMRV